MLSEAERIVETPFERGWWSFDLGTYRPCDGTYCLFDVDRLPSLPPLDDTLSWLGPQPGIVEQPSEVHRRRSEVRERLQALVGEAGRLGLRLPLSFLRLMSSPELQDRIPSCTACEFELGSRIVPCPGSPGGYALLFLRDQQDCVLWYLYLTPDGGHCVLASLPDLEEYAEDAEGNEHGERATPEQLASAIRVCAPSFTAFISRFWLENVLWFKLNGDDKAPLSADEQRYLDHYRQHV